MNDEKLLRLLAAIIASHESSPGRGLPIGSLTSQHLANLFLGPFDRFVKQHLRRAGYVRYMDDSVLWGATAELWGLAGECESFLQAELLLTCKAPRVRSVKSGWGFLGCRVFPGWLTLNRRSRRRYAAKIRELARRLQAGEIDELTCQQRAESLTAFTSAAGVKSWRFRSRVL